jgi:serine/threonine protein kinase
MTLSFDDVSQATCDFDKDHILGNSGIMGPLYRGTLIDGMMVVVRKLPRGMLTKDEDLGTLYSIQYRYCLPLRNHFICKGSTFLVYDYMANGSLEQTLHGEFFNVLEIFGLVWSDLVNNFFISCRSE